MFYSVINSDIFKAVAEKQIQFFGHGANCWSTMGAGVARVVANRMHELYDADKRFHLLPDARLGRYSNTTLRNGVEGFNLYTQYYPGPEAKIEMIRSSLTLALESVAEEMVPEQEVNFGIPALGCGIGGLKFSEFAQVAFEVTELLKQDYPFVTVNLCVFTLPGEFIAEVNQCAELGLCRILENSGDLP